MRFNIVFIIYLLCTILLLLYYYNCNCFFTTSGTIKGQFSPHGGSSSTLSTGAAAHPHRSRRRPSLTPSPLLVK